MSSCDGCCVPLGGISDAMSTLITFPDTSVIVIRSEGFDSAFPRRVGLTYNEALLISTYVIATLRGPDTVPDPDICETLSESHTPASLSNVAPGADSGRITMGIPRAYSDGVMRRLISDA
jgi:hypothetical protein